MHPDLQQRLKVKSFLGLVGYYRDYIPHFASVAVPLTDLLRKRLPTKVDWGEAQQKAFVSLKYSLTGWPILHVPDFDKVFVLHTDGSNNGVGALLSQEFDAELFPVAYASKKLLPREKAYSVIELEGLAIVWGVHEFQTYLYGREFVLQTDNQPLTFINSSKVSDSRVMRWALFLQNYRFQIRQVKGKYMAADYLSRMY